MDELDRLGGGRLAVGRVDDLDTVDVEIELARHGGDLGGRANQNRRDDAGLGRLERTAQRSLVTGMSHDRRRRRHLFRPGDEVVVFRVRRRPGWSGLRRGFGLATVFRGKHD